MAGHRQPQTARARMAMSIPHPLPGLAPSRLRGSDTLRQGPPNAEAKTRLGCHSPDPSLPELSIARVKTAPERDYCADRVWETKDDQACVTPERRCLSHRAGVPFANPTRTGASGGAATPGMGKSFRVIEGDWWQVAHLFLVDVEPDAVRAVAHAGCLSFVLLLEG